MITEVFSRHEKKYLIDQDTYEILLERLDGIITEDSHNKEEEFYSICNVYYDTLTDELIRNSIEKPVYKEKFRLRSYGTPGLEDDVFLEIKKKYKGMVYKRRTVLPLSQAYMFIDYRKVPDKSFAFNKQIINEISFFIKNYSLYPKLYICYDRKAYYGAADESLRITFDTNIRTRRDDLKLESGSYGELLLEKGLWLMEIKVGHAMPVWLSNILSECKLYPTSFSKYGTEYKNNVCSILDKKRGESYV